MTALVGALVVALPGCGGEGGPDLASARFAPADVSLFLALESDFESARWDELERLLARFPDGERALTALLARIGGPGTTTEDLEDAVGPEIGVAVLARQREEGAVVFTQPEDRGRAEELLRGAGAGAVRTIDGWVVAAADEEALADFAQARAQGRLADDGAYERLAGELPGDALAYSFSAGEALSQAGARTTLAFTPEEDGVRLEGASEAGDLATAFEPTLTDVVPGDAFLYATAANLEAWLSTLREAFAAAQPELERDLGRLEAALDVSLEEDVFSLLRGEAALYARPGGFVPEVTLVAEVEDEAAARDALERLFRGLADATAEVGAPRPTDIAGMEATEVPVGQLTLYYALVDGRLVVTSARLGIADLLAGGEGLDSSPAFRSAREEADLPDEPAAFVYADLDEAVGTVLGVLDLAGEGRSVPAETRRNLEPLDRVLVHAEEADDGLVRLAGFLAVE